MTIPVQLDLGEIDLILTHLPDDSITHDLRIRLQTIMSYAPVFAANSGRGLQQVAAPTAPTTASPDEETTFEPQPWPTNLPPLVGTPPYGWRRHGERLVHALEEIDVMIHVLQGRKREWSYAQIANDLNSRMLYTRNGSKWNSSGISRIYNKSIEHPANAPLKARFG